MKPIEFLGTTREDIRDFEGAAKYEAGHELLELQKGNQPSNWKPMPSIGKGVEEIRIKTEDGQFRIIYYARHKDKIYALHAFQKKTQKTSPKDINLAKKRYSQITE